MKCPILSGKRPYGLFTNHMSQHILIIGSGALACLFSARLARTGQPVTLTGSWEAGISAIRKNGVGLLVGGKIEYSPISLLDNSQATQKFRSAILLTKTYQIAETLTRVMPYLAEDGSVLSLQNGLTARDRMVEVIGEQRAISGITTCAAELVDPGVVRHNGGSSIFLGKHPEIDGYRNLLVDAGFTVNVVSDIRKMIWEKAVINSAANPLGAILRMRNGEMAAQPDVMHLMDELIREACTVARADGFNVEQEAMQKRIREVLDETSNNRCSMLQDFLHGRETEINDINGAMIDLASKYQIPTPVQSTVTQIVRSIRKEVH
jgi:2-dehydropantoate 2-reductase